MRILLSFGMFRYIGDDLGPLHYRLDHSVFSSLQAEADGTDGWLIIPIHY